MVDEAGTVGIGSVDPGEAEETEEQSSAYVAFAYVAAAAFVVFAAGVCVLDRYGEDLVQQLSGQMGEITYQRAKELYEKGEVTLAIEKYREALAVPFEDARQRGWALREFGRLLMQEENPSEAVPLLQECLRAYPDDLVAHGLLCSALHQTGQYALLLSSANAWYAEAVRQASPLNQAHAKYHAGSALEKSERLDDALAAYLEGYAADPSAFNGYHAGRLLHQQGDFEKASEILTDFLKYGSGWRAKGARTILDSIRAATPGAPAG